MKASTADNSAVNIVMMSNRKRTMGTKQSITTGKKIDSDGNMVLMAVIEEEILL